MTVTVMSMRVHSVPDPFDDSSRAAVVSASDLGQVWCWVVRDLRALWGVSPDGPDPDSLDVAYAVSASSEFHRFACDPVDLRAAHGCGSKAVVLRFGNERALSMPADARVTASWSYVSFRGEELSGERTWFVSLCPPGLPLELHQMVTVLRWDAHARGEVLPVARAREMAEALLSAPR